ncbi:uncharacterized protein LOC133188992 [Saccostrea echinata]|uniref:uncharacterized protein LOC133188992 n=1 Tax=Saccostrea echinata TaxID=191078 RepID=UPI002A813547|nr:uncharacterized protein LOC133188992 [Saccostrea echinata]
MANGESHRKYPLMRSASFDPSDLQRPPSIHSIRSHKLLQSLSLPGTDPASTITEEDNISFESNQDKYTAGRSDCSQDNFITISKDPEKDFKESPAEPFLRNNESKLLNEDQESDASEEASDDISEEGGCIECVKAIPVFLANEIEKGDHIVFAGALYDHHGIVVEKFKENERKFGIVEATNTISKAAAGIVFGGKAKIVNTIKVFNFETDNIRIVEYRNPKFSKPEIVSRAMKFLSTASKAKKFKYHLFANNCEHFATYCVTGKRFSVQVRKVRMIAKMFFSSGFRGISDEKLRNEKEFECQIICQQCFEVNKKLLSASVTPIKQSDDVNFGDIIRYSYWNLWHDAVVLKISKKEKKYLICEIAHYCFHGPFSHREIIREELKVSFNGEFSVVHYDPPLYDVYDPDTVVERAKDRIGEKLFVHFSNDSSHFARWCKLKLTKSSEADVPTFYCDRDV